MTPWSRSNPRQSSASAAEAQKGAPKGEVDAVEIKHLAVRFVKTGYGAAGMIAAALLLAVSLFQPAARAADGSFERVKSNGLVVCGTDGLLPYSSSDEKVPGFEVEIARALAAELGVQTKHQWVSWDGL